MSTLLFVSHTAAAAEKLRSKSRLWENSLRVNIFPSMEESSYLIVIGIGPRHINWVTEEAAAKGLANLLSTLWSDTHTLVEELLSLMRHNSRERQARVDCAVEYEIVPIHFL